MTLEFELCRGPRREPSLAIRLLDEEHGGIVVAERLLTPVPYWWTPDPENRVAHVRLVPEEDHP